jgi:hypothetical protein
MKLFTDRCGIWISWIGRVASVAQDSEGVAELSDFVVRPILQASSLVNTCFVKKQVRCLCVQKKWLPRQPSCNRFTISFLIMDAEGGKSRSDDVDDDLLVIIGGKGM